MLTQYHYRFLKLAEEATEIAHRVAKLMQFGPGEREPGQIYTNAERVRLEMMDLMTCYSELVHRGDLTEITDVQFEEHETVKLAKMEKFLKLSIDLGEVEPDTKVNADHAEERHAAVAEALADLDSHRDVWRSALVGAMSAEAEGGDLEQAAYWEHEIKAFDRTFSTLGPS